MSSDLHTHTSYSDGKMTPEELIEAAKEVGLRYIAITDHDTVEGVTHLYEAGLLSKKGLGIIAGIEFSTQYKQHEVHILGYNIDIYQRDLLDCLNNVSEARWSRFAEMVEKLQELGYGIKEADVLQVAGTSKSISRSHIGRTLVRKGFFKSVREAFDAVLSKGCPAYVSHYRLEPQEVVTRIKDAGGIPVLAHPKLVGNDALVEEVLAIGIEGIEAFYPQHDTVDTARYVAMAKRRHLLITGGSDFHGFTSRYPQELGIFTVEDALAEQLYKPGMF